MSLNGVPRAGALLGLLARVALTVEIVTMQVPSLTSPPALPVGGVICDTWSTELASSGSSSVGDSPLQAGSESRASASRGSRFLIFRFVMVPPLLADLHDLRGDEDQELTILVRDVAGLEQPAEHRDLAEPGHPGLALTLVDREDTADHGGTAIGDQHL